MAIKRVVNTAFWSDGKVEEFTPEDRYFMLYLLTNPQTTQLGIYEFSIKRAAFELGYSPEAVKALLDRFERVHRVIIHSKKTNEIAILNYLRHSIIKGGAPVRDCLIKEMNAVKNKALIQTVFNHIKGSNSLNDTVKNLIADYEESHGHLRYCNEKNDTSHDTSDDTYHDLYHNDNENENENDNDIENENGNDNGISSTGRKSHPVPYEAIRKMYNEICISYPHCRVLSDARKKAIKARMSSGYTLEDFKTLFEKAEASSFLKGKNDRNWRASLDWFVKDANMAKVLDGNFDDRGSSRYQEPLDYGNPEDFYK